MNLDLEILLPQLWGDKTYEQESWGHLNYLIGPNGTGKTLFAEELERQIYSYQVRRLSAERLSGMETETYRQFTNTALNQGFNIEQTDRYRQQAQQGGLSSDAYVELRDKPDLKIRIQAILSEFFNRD